MGILRLAHVDVRTPDLELSAAYYTEVLGLQLAERGEDTVYLKCWDEEDHHSIRLRYNPRTGLAGGHSAAARDFETIRSRVRGREDLVDEMAGAASAGLVRAHAMLAAAIAPRNAALAAFAAEARPDPDAVRRELLAAVGGRTQWHPPEEPGS